MIEDPGTPEEQLENELEQFSSQYRRGMSQELKRILEEWGLKGHEQLRAEERLWPILDRSVAEIVGELERTLRPLADSSAN